MRWIAPLLFLFLFSATVQAATIDNIFWTPEEPKAGDEVTVSAEISGNVSTVILQYCIGDACYYLDMQKNGELYQVPIPSNRIKGGISVELNVTATDDNATVYEIREFTVEKNDGNTPGFELIVVLAAVLIIVVTIKTRKSM